MIVKADPNYLHRLMLSMFSSPPAKPKRWWQFWRRPRRYTHIWKRPYEPDGDGEGTWYVPFPDHPGPPRYCWRPPSIKPEERCPSEECLFGREWIQCKKRRGHKGVHRHSETWGWDEGDERA